MLFRLNPLAQLRGSNRRCDMRMLGHEIPDDAVDSHKCYIINGDELYWLMEIEGMLARMGRHDDSMTLNKIIKSALDNELEDEE